jgi:hypothetical protein
VVEEALAIGSGEELSFSILERNSLKQKMTCKTLVKKENPPKQLFKNVLERKIQSRNNKNTYPKAFSRTSSARSGACVESSAENKMD